jgi:hypothetical protein
MSTLVIAALFCGQSRSPVMIPGYNPQRYADTYLGDFANLSSKPPEEQVILHSAQLMIHLNNQRDKLHLRPLDYSLQLEAMCMTNNAQQVAAGRIGHYTPPRSRVAQLVAHAPTWGSAWDRWAKESTNRDILTSRDAVRMGVTCYRYYWTLEVEMAGDLGIPHPHSAPAGRSGDPGAQTGQDKRSTDEHKRMDVEIPPTARPVELPEDKPPVRIRTVPRFRQVAVPPLPGEGTELPPVASAYERR